MVWRDSHLIVVEMIINNNSVNDEVSIGGVEILSIVGWFVGLFVCWFV